MGGFFTSALDALLGYVDFASVWSCTLHILMKDPKDLQLRRHFQRIGLAWWVDENTTARGEGRWGKAPATDTNRPNIDLQLHVYKDLGPVWAHSKMQDYQLPLCITDVRTGCSVVWQDGGSVV